MNTQILSYADGYKCTAEAEDAFHFRALNIHPVREGEGGRGREMRKREGEIRRQ